MSSDTTKDIVHRGEEFHRALEGYYRSLKERVTEERAKMALDFLVQHEASMASSVRAYEKDLPYPMSDRWFKYSPNEALAKEMAETVVPPDIGVSRLMELALHFSQSITCYYKQFAETAVPEPLDEALNRLLEFEQEGQKKITAALQQQT